MNKNNLLFRFENCVKDFVHNLDYGFTIRPTANSRYLSDQEFYQRSSHILNSHVWVACKLSACAVQYMLIQLSNSI